VHCGYGESDCGGKNARVWTYRGLTAQTSAQIAESEAQGGIAASAYKLIKDAPAVEKAGAVYLVSEALSPAIGRFMGEDPKRPFYRIGAGP
jgi:3-methyl-2-oxobutanoate hydroxymethyltransferase